MAKQKKRETFEKRKRGLEKRRKREEKLRRRIERNAEKKASKEEGDWAPPPIVDPDADLFEDGDGDEDEDEEADRS